MRQAVEAGSLPAACERLSLVPGIGRNGHLALKLNLAIANSDRPLWQQVTDWEREGRALVDELQRFLVKNTAAAGTRTVLPSPRNSASAPVAAFRDAPGWPTAMCWPPVNLPGALPAAAGQWSVGEMARARK